MGRRALQWLKEWGSVVATVGTVAAWLLALVAALGFGVHTPREVYAQLEHRVRALEITRDSIVREVQAQSRYLCFKDRAWAELAGLDCRRLTANRIPPP